jgi:hypothetical protein
MDRQEENIDWVTPTEKDAEIEDGQKQYTVCDVPISIHTRR